ncbi:porin [Advenella alkanexedens]|uniref:porin n=1 Tax=Advenella alkanexedens TaxID=1481665 RepID=UPI002676DC73|nr:porin [Advenella alkanexedens]WKU18945.1 porin [Advenella alkanexedens]
MKKTLLTAALVAGFASVAHAESSVTLYGLVDGGVGYNTQKTTWSGDFGNGSFKTRGFEFKNGVKNGNRWGLKGTEDLGNGTSAIFQLESGFDLGNGRSGQGDRLFGRKAVVGLTGESWGTLTLGRQYNVADDFLAPIDPFGTGWGQAAIGSAFGGSVSARYDNVVKYVTPNFSGFQAGLGWTGDNNKETYRNDTYGVDYDAKDSTNGITFGLGYNNGPIQAGFSYDYLRSKQKVNGVTVGDDKVKAWNLGFAYDFDVVKLHLMYGQQNDGQIGGIGLAGDIVLPDFTGGVETVGNGIAYDGFRQKSWMLGLTAPVSEAGKVLFSYTGNNIKNKEDFDGKITSHIFNLGYLHSLSKRTSVYAVASYGQSKLKINETAFNGQAKLKSTEVVLGLQHRF